MRRETRNAFERIYLYSSDGIIGYEEDGEKFLYRKNLFGDIIAIYKGTTKVAEYVYDAWGNCTITYDPDGYGASNPIRYRGYYWDSDIKMYYLMTRYYDPKIGRFINADSFEYLDPKSINGLNLYAYCRNNPIMHIDPMGTQFCQTSFDGEYDLDDDMYNNGLGGGGGGYYGYGSAYYTYTVRTNTATYDAQLGGYHSSGTTSAMTNPSYFIVPGAVTVNDSMVVRTTSVYRSIGEAEARDISTTGKFNISQRGMDCKQFGFNYDETCQFGDKMGQSIIVSAQLPTDSLDYFYNVGVDSAIFKHGTLTVYKEDLGLFNYLTRGTIVITYR